MHLAEGQSQQGMDFQPPISEFQINIQATSNPAILQNQRELFQLGLRQVQERCQQFSSTRRNLPSPSSTKDVSDSEEGDNTTSNWSKHLPREIMGLILQKLSVNDYICLASVCKSWQSHVFIAIASKNSSPKPEFPLLIFSTHPHSLSAKQHFDFLNLSNDAISCGSRRVCDYVTNRLRQHLEGRNCVGYIEGWLILADKISWRPESFFQHAGFDNSKDFFSYLIGNVRNYMLNPMTGSSIKLPSQSTIPCSGSSLLLFFNKVVASSAPTCPDCIVAAQTFDHDLVFCRPSCDQKWTVIDEKETGLRFRDMEFAKNNLLYAIVWGAGDFIMVYDLNGPNYEAKKMLILDPLPVPSIGSWTREGDIWKVSNYANLHLLNDTESNQLFMIVRIASDFACDDKWRDHFLSYHETPPLTKGFRVFKLEHVDGSELGSSSGRWLVVESLGDSVMFVDGRSCKFVSSVAVSRMRAGMGMFGGNCIYFAFEYHSGKGVASDVGVFSLADGSIQHLVPTFSSRFVVLPPVWFTPSFW